MQWTEADSTGVEVLDEHHRMLFRMTADFREALDEGRGGAVYELLLDSLEAFAAGHFDAESRLAPPECCPKAAENAEAHERFLQEFEGYRRLYLEHGFREGDARGACEFLEGWLHEHILGVDVHLRHCPKHRAAS